MNNNFNITYKNICDSLNIIFLNIENDIKNFIYKIYKIKTRKSKVSFIDTFIYATLYTQINKTKTDVINELNLITNNNEIFNRTTLYEKEIKIPLEFYVDIFNKITKLYNDNFNDDEFKKLVAIDGTYNNTNVYNIKGFLETSLNMGFLDVINEIPLDLTFYGIKNKNNELKVLIEYINNNIDKFKNVIIILDRAYCSYNFINFLNKKNINYVCRFRNNCSNLNKVVKNIRIVNFINYYYESVNNNDIDHYLINNKKFKSVKVKIKDDYNLITNLKKELYTDDKIKEIYHKRWDIEVFFKILKNNFKFENLRITNADQLNNPYNIHNVKILIVYTLSKLFEKIYQKVNNIKTEGTIVKRKYKNKKNKKIDSPYQNKNNKTKNKDVNKEKTIINKDISNNTKIQFNKNTNLNDNIKKEENIKCVLKSNKSLIIKAVYGLITDIFKSELTELKLKKTLNIFVKYSKVDTTINKKRTCKTPFKKWYIKGYTNKSDLNKIVNFIIGFINEINKNLKMKSKNITIIGIDYI